MTDIKATADQVADTPDWNARVALIRRAPETFGTAQHAEVYATIAERVYIAQLEPDFAYVHWREDYELPRFIEAYHAADNLTGGFSRVAVADLAQTIRTAPSTLVIFRLLLGLVANEFVETCALVAAEHELTPLSSGLLSRIENGAAIPPPAVAETCATVIDLVMRGDVFPPVPAESGLRRKLDKPDTAEGWTTVRRFAREGVPLSVLLHQRAYGGAFRQLLDATSNRRGNQLEDPVERVFKEAGVPYIRTGAGAANQAEVQRRFGLTVKPAPDFVVFNDDSDVLRGMLECKGANDGGTARDKAARFRALRAEANRLGGMPLFAVLGGMGWRRAKDALGPVVRDTDGRVFTLPTLDEMLTVEPFPALRASQGS